MSFLEAFDIVVLDPGILRKLSASHRSELLGDLQRRSRPGGVHVILPTCAAIAPESLRSFYGGWLPEEDTKRKRLGRMSPPCLMLGKSLCAVETA